MGRLLDFGNGFVELRGTTVCGGFGVDGLDRERVEFLGCESHLFGEDDLVEG